MILKLVRLDLLFKKRSDLGSSEIVSKEEKRRRKPFSIERTPSIRVLKFEERSRGSGRMYNASEGCD